MMANTFHAYVNLENYMPWIELFGLIEEDAMTQKRILSVVSGAILPIVALGFIKSLTDYIKPKEDDDEIEQTEDVIQASYDSYYEERNELFEELTKKNEENYKTEEPLTVEEPIKEITETNNIKDDKQTEQTNEKSNNPQAQYVSKKIKYKP